MYHALHESGLAAQYIIQDVAIPYSKVNEFMEYLNWSFRSYPIWLCPLKQSGNGIASTHSLQANKTKRNLPEMMLNFGVWGPGSNRREEFVAWNRQFEGTVHRLGGQKWLYAHAYYTEEEFDEIYNRRDYELLRGKYHASYLPSVFDKVRVDIVNEQKALRESRAAWLLASFWRIWPLTGLYGVCKAFLGGDYLVPKTSSHGLTDLYMCAG
jgi:hypothetical protein